MELQVTTAELELLSHILEERYRELERQIGHTDHHEFRLVLQEERRLLLALLEKVNEKVKMMQPAAS